MEFRKIFDTIPEQFDKFRPRYSQELFDSLIAYAKIGPGKKSTGNRTWNRTGNRIGLNTGSNNGTRKFDLIYSAATIQWIPEDIAFSKAYELLAPGGTHCDHMVIAEPYKTNFFEGLLKAVLAHDNIFYDTYVMYLTKKPI